MSSFSKAVYPWEHAHWSDANPRLTEAYLAESRISDLEARAQQVELSAEEFLARISARAVMRSDGEKPKWWQWLDAAQSAQLSQPFSHGLNDAEFALLGLFEPEIAHALSELQKIFAITFGEDLAPHLVSLCAPGLLRRIWTLAHPALLLELKLARQQAELKATTATARFSEFCAQLKTTRRAPLQDLYPLLWRDIASFCMNHQSRRCELFADIERHAQELSTRFGFPVSLFSLSLIQSEVADLHNGGRSTLLLNFGLPENQQRCVYKPRNLQIESSFLAFYKAILSDFDHALEIPRFVHGSDAGREYGFMEFVSHRMLNEPDGALPEPAKIETAADYAWRLGALLAITDSLLGNDLHYENIIADGASPIPIDVETLFQPFMRAELGGEHPGDLMRLTPFRVGILPRTHSRSSTEFSPFFANEGKRYKATDLVDVGSDTMRLESFERGRSSRDLHLPRGRDGTQSLFNHALAFEQGWTSIRLELERRWASLISPGGAVAEMSQFPIRLIARATDHYHMIANSICAPRYLQCAAKRLALIDRIWQGFVPTHQDGNRFQSEVEALACSEIPYFFGWPRERSLWAENVRVHEAFPDSAWNQVLLRAGSSAQELKRARAALRTAFVVSLEHDHRLRKLPIELPTLRTSQSRREAWQKVLRNVADLLAAKRYQDDQHSTWLCFEASNDGFSIRTTGLDLYSGLAGIGLSFARLAASEFGQAQDLQIAQHCFASIAFRLRANPLALTQIGFAGAGGVLYGAAIVASLLHPNGAVNAEFQQIEAQCLKFLRASRTAPKAIDEMDVIGGAAGALLGLCAAWQNSLGRRTLLQEEISALVALILERATTTGAHVQPTGSNASNVQPGLAWQSSNYPTMLTGMAHGASGIAVALSKARECLQANEQPSQAVLQAAMRFETQFIQPPHALWQDARFGIVEDAEQCCMAWCHGAPGLLMARLIVADPSLDAAAFSAQLDRVIAEGFEQDWVLCHGALGQLMILQRIMQAGKLSAQRFAEIECAVLDAWERAWPILSEQAVQPGLFDGLAGAMYCVLDMLDVRPGLNLLAYATELEKQT
jgi:type 2 lantibiotic biosynthesis protein LanM